MAELFADPSFWKNNGQQPAGNYTGNPEIDRELDQMPEEERQAALAEITAPPTGEEIAGMIQAKQAVGEVANVTREEYRLYKAYSKTKETDVIEAIGMGAEMVWNDLQKAAGSMYDKPIDSIAKLTPSLIEAFSQGTRGMYGMLAESQDPNSVLFRVKNAIYTGSDEDAEYEQFMQALDFNAKSTRLMQGKETMVMDKDLINAEMTQAMSYIADPSLFIPFEGVALKGAQLIGMAEGLAKASARATAIKQMVIGGTLRWGVGAPIEAIGGATRATIDAAVERGSRAISAVTGMQTGEIASAARMTGLSTLTADAAGLASGVSQAYVGASAARGIGEAIGAVGEQMMRGERGVLSYARQALRESMEGGAKLTPQAENLLKAIDFVDPMFSYTADVTKGATQGAFIGGGLGYLSGGEEGMAQGIGAGAVLGGVGGGFGRIYADISGATKTDRMRITTDLGLNILAETNPTVAKDYSTLRAVAQAKGVNVDGYISGLLRIAPDLDTYFKGGVDHSAEITARGFDPKTYDGSFVDQNGRRLFSMAEFERAEGFVIDKAKDGRVTLGINLDNLKKNTVPHEAFHTIFRSVVMEPEFQKRMTESVLGAFDKDGKQISAPKVSQTEAVAFFDRYLKALHKGDKLNEQRGLLKQALEEYYRDGQTKVMAEDGKTPYLANLSEEFGAYYFTQFIEGKPLDYLFLGGELGGVRGIMQSVQDGWLDYWEGRAKRVEPKFDMNNPDGIDYAFKPKGGSRVRVGAIDYLMQDLVRAASQRRQDGSINLSRMSRDTRDQFLRSQGLDGVGETKAKPFRPSASKGQDTVKIYNKTFGPEVHKAILAMPDNLRPAVDGNGDFVGPLSKEVLEQMVSSGHVSREMSNKVQVLQDMASGKMQSNIAEMGYVGWSMQQDVGPNPPRVYGDDVPYKRRKVLVLDVESKIGPKGMSFTAKTLDWQVIETRANNLWSDSRVRNRWNDDRGVFVQDFFRYLSNASKTDAQGRVPSNKLWAQDGDVKRDVMQQMAGIPKQAGETYAHPPIAEIHEDILNSVMNLTVNRMSDVRITGDNVFFDANKAAPFIRVNMKVADMPYEETPNGKVFTDNQSGFRFTQTAKGVTAFDRHGEFIGSYANLDDAGKFAKRVYERQQAAMKQVAMQVTDEASRGVTHKSKAQLVQDNASMSVKSWLDSKISAESSGTNKDYIIESLERGIGHLIDEQGNPNKALIDAVNAGFSESQNALAQANILKKLKAGETVDAKELATAFHPKALDVNGNFTGKTAKLSSEGILFAVESPDGKTEIKLDRHIETLQIELNKAIISSSDAWEAMFPRTFRSRLLDKVQSLHKDNPNLSNQALIKKLLRDSSNGYRFYAEAEASGLIDFLRSQIDPAQSIQKQRDAQGNWTGGIKTVDKPFADNKIRGGRTDLPIDLEAITDFIKNNELTLMVDSGAKADLGDTSKIVQEGTVLGYNETALRLPKKFSHGVTGHYGEATVHHRSTARTDVNGEQVTYIDEIQANNAKPEEISESNFKRSQEIESLLEKEKIADKVRRLELKQYNDTQSLTPRTPEQIRKTLNQVGEIESNDAVALVRQKNMFNVLLNGYVELYRNNQANYIKEVERVTSKGGTYEIKGGKPDDVQQHWANVLELHKSGEFLKHLESFRIKTDKPEEILGVLEKIKEYEGLRWNKEGDKIPTLDKTKTKESAGIIDSLRKSSQYIYESTGYLIQNKTALEEFDFGVLRNIMPSLPTGIGNSIGSFGEKTIGSKDYQKNIINALLSDSKVTNIVNSISEANDKIASLLKRLPDMSHLRVQKDEKPNAQRLAEILSLAKTNIKKYNQVKGRKPFPLEEISEWSAVALKDIITKSIADGRDLITITHPDDSPVHSNMEKDARYADYGRIFPDVAQKIVGKYGIEVKQRSELPALTEPQMTADNGYKSASDARNKAVADAMDEFKKTQGQGESPDVISELSLQFSRTPENLINEFTDFGIGIGWFENKIMPLLGQVKSDELRSKLVDVAQRITDQTSQFVAVKDAIYSQYDPSVIAIDRGMSFRLNKEIKEAVMNGELRTAYKPLDEYQGGDDYYKPRSNPFESRDEQGFLIREPYIRKPARTASGEKFEMNPDSVSWKDVGHFTRLTEKETGLSDNELYKWENNDVGLWAVNADNNSVVTKNNINPREIGFRYTHGEWFDEPFWKKQDSSIWGRYEKPIYDNNGNIVRRGRISLTSQYRGQVKDMAHAKRIKNDIAKKVKASAEDIDAYMFDASDSIKQSMGFSPKDQLPIKFKPEETPDWNTERAVQARANQPMKLWEYPTTVNFTKWVGGLPLIRSLSSQTDAKALAQGFVTTIYKGVRGRNFDTFKDRNMYGGVARDSYGRDVTGQKDPNYFVSDLRSARDYAEARVSMSDEVKKVLKEQKAYSFGKADMYYVRSEKPAVLTDIANLNPEVIADVRKFWEKYIQDEFAEDYSGDVERNNLVEYNFDVFMKMVVEGRFLEADMDKKDMYFAINKKYAKSEQLGHWNDLWTEFSKFLLDKGYDSVVVNDNTVSKNAPTIVIDQSSKNVKASSNYGEFNPDDVRFNFKPAGDAEEGGRTYTERQLEREFIGRYAAENPEVSKGLEIKYEDRVGEDDPEYGMKQILLMKDGTSVGSIKFDLEDNHFYVSDSESIRGKFVQDISVKVKPEYQGNKYQHILYSEMFERARSLGAVAFRQEIENKMGLPLKSTNKIVGQDGSVIWTLAEHELQKPTQENFDRLMAGAPRVKSNYMSNEPHVSHVGKLDPKAYYKPEEGDAPLRVNFSPDEVKKNLRSLQSAIDRQSDSDKIPAGIKKGVGRLIQAVERQRKEDVKTMPQAVKEGFKALADAVDAQADMDKVPAGVRKGLRLLFESAQYEDLKPQQGMPKPTASEEQLASGIEALGRAVGVSGQVRRQPQPQAKPAPTAAMPQAQTAPAAQPTPPPLPVRPTPEPSSTAWMSWTQEKTENGGFIRNALGYVIVVNKSKFKVYNPAKVLVGIYEDEESAKRRVLKDMPRR